MKGEFSIAVVREMPRIGHELAIKVHLKGVAETFLEDVKVEIHIDELCDDASEPEST